MTDSIVIQADYADFVFKRGLKSARVSFDIPIEQGAWFIEKFGAPDPANPVKVAIARLNIGPQLQANAEQSSAAVPNSDAAKAEEKPHRPLKDLPAPQQAALMCEKGEFGDFLKSRGHHHKFTVERLYAELHIASRSELSGESKRGEWLALMADFDRWRTSQRYGGVR